jgi:H+/Cl- antiporter ClcA
MLHKSALVYCCLLMLYLVSSCPYHPCTLRRPVPLCAGLLSLRTLVCKLVAVAFSMGGGLIAGKDGPLIHGGGTVGGGLGGMGSRCA